MLYYFSEYANLTIFPIIAAGLGLVLLGLSFVISRKRTLDPEKLSAYECGFDPFSDCRSEFNIHFYLIGILFIIFDLEVVLLFPWATTVGSLEPFAIWSVVDFFIELTLGLVYVWLMGALEI